MAELILGGVRSGKSRFAASLARDDGRAVTVVATALAADAQMRRRIAEHRAARPREWRVVEEPFYLAERLLEETDDDRCVIVDCLTLWLTNLLCHHSSSSLNTQIEHLVSSIGTLAGRLIVVSNETGLGIMPPGELSRRFCDEAGKLHQRLAAECDRVVFVTAGLPQVLKGEPR